MNRGIYPRDELTARYARTLNEAFPDTADYAASVERSDRPSRFDRACWVVALLMLLLVFWAAFRLPG